MSVSIEAEKVQGEGIEISLPGAGTKTFPGRGHGARGVDGIDGASSAGGVRRED